jgi:hypothetical protein
MGFIDTFLGKSALRDIGWSIPIKSAILEEVPFAMLQEYPIYV